MRYANCVFRLAAWSNETMQRVGGWWYVSAIDRNGVYSFTRNKTQAMVVERNLMEAFRARYFKGGTIRIEVVPASGTSHEVHIHRGLGRVEGG